MTNTLIIEKSAAIRKILRRLIRNSDLPIGQIYEASDANEALDALKQNAVGLIISGVDLPDSNGLQLLMEIRETEGLKEVPVILISTKTSLKRVLEAVKLGAAEYISTPLMADDIREKLADLLFHRKAVHPPAH